MNLEFVTLGIIIFTVIFSYKGFSDIEFFSKYTFETEKVLLYKDYKRLISAAFLHTGWQHLIFNMLTLYFFGSIIEIVTGHINYLIIFIVSLLGGNLLTLYMHRNHSNYSAVGASGAAAGIIFASIGIFPGISISPLLLPIGIPGWLFGIIYLIYCIYGIKNDSDNIAHDAHLGGAASGLIIVIIMYPSHLLQNYITIILLLTLIGGFFYLTIRRPDFLFVKNFFSEPKGFRTIEDKYNTVKKAEQEEIDTILDKINRKGIKSLTKEEKETLDIFSKKNI